VAKFPHHRHGLRGTVGVAAAFVLALQMLLAGVLATQMAVAAPAGPSAICYGEGHGTDSDSPSKSRIYHASCAVCTLASFAPPVPDAAPSLTVVATVHAVVHPLRNVSPLADRHHDPRSSQGPPQAA
jgi:hypothetical protein